MKRSFFQAAVTSILLYGCTTWTLTKRLEKKLDGNYTRMLRAILNKSWRQHPTRHQLYGHLPPITKTIQVRRTRHAGHCWRSRDELIRDVLLWIPTHGRAKAGRPARTYIQQLCEDTGCCPEDLPRAMNDREEWRKRVRDIRAASTIWWWWWLILNWIVWSRTVLTFNWVKQKIILILNWIVWSRTVLTFNWVKRKIILILNWIVWSRTVLTFNWVKQKIILILNWIVWSRTVLTFNWVKQKIILILNWIVWSRTVLTFNWVKRKIILILNWIVWSRTVLTFNWVKQKIILILNWIVGDFHLSDLIPY